MRRASPKGKPARRRPASMLRLTSAAPGPNAAQSRRRQDMPRRPEKHGAAHIGKVICIASSDELGGGRHGRQNRASFVCAAPVCNGQSFSAAFAARGSTGGTAAPALFSSGGSSPPPSRQKNRERVHTFKR
jgi:hypothetical protein